ncbi:unnamed protein product, partial [Choristocarpus tenellus]
PIHICPSRPKSCKSHVTPFHRPSRNPHHQAGAGTISPEQDVHARRGIKPNFTATPRGCLNSVLAALAPMLQPVLTQNSSPVVCPALNNRLIPVPGKHCKCESILEGTSFSLCVHLGLGFFRGFYDIFLLQNISK